ncbi:expressed protein [Echinococcus multilocularis]|uniref:Expressed protein n=1 Tax=Echinococcus multilocularis TaxID=6211 RepID=A0A068YDL6_ECHMU|nr:expressed protein [Echinococcus multilocularis]
MNLQSRLQELLLQGGESEDGAMRNLCHLIEAQLRDGKHPSEATLKFWIDILENPEKNSMNCLAETFENPSPILPKDVQDEIEDVVKRRNVKARLKLTVVCDPNKVVAWPKKSYLTLCKNVTFTIFFALLTVLILFQLMVVSLRISGLID